MEVYRPSTVETLVDSEGALDSGYAKTDSKLAVESLGTFELDGYTAKHARALSSGTEVFENKRNRLLELIRGTKRLLERLSLQAQRGIRYPASTRATSHDGDTTVSESASIHSHLDSPLTILCVDSKSQELSDEGSLLASTLLVDKVKTGCQYLDRLFARVSDRRSKVLVTGDLNAGKSTFVNAMLRREVVPHDQQPCTALFCEIVDADQNMGVEEVHAIKDPCKYSRDDTSTFTRYTLSALPGLVEDNEEDYAVLKAYCRDNRTRERSFIGNGLVDISLIDSPGLNIDSMKTTALFSQQEEIDVIVFVVNAENHFTLSGREFLDTAGKEKAYVFIVVNRFDQIRRQDRCKRDILEQIRQISPRTYEDADNLVHFVSAKQCLESGQDEGFTPSEFSRLEDSLRHFVLEKRSKSKLAPAKVYLDNILMDVVKVARYNSAFAELESQELDLAVKSTSPVFEKMLTVKSQAFDNLEKTIDRTDKSVRAYTRDQLDSFMRNIDLYVQHVDWNGIFYVWQYARDLRTHIYRLAAMRVKRSEMFARDSAVACIQDIEKITSSCFELPKSADIQGMAVSIMDHDDASGIRDSNLMAMTTSTPGSQARPRMVALELSDLFDAADKFDVFQDYIPSVVLMATGLVGYRSLALNLNRMSQYLGFANLGKIAFAGMAVAGVGYFFYMMADVRYSVEKKVARKMKSHLSEIGFVEENTERLAKATTRALRLSMWEFHNQFQKVILANQQERNQKMALKQASDERRRFFLEVEGLAEELRDKLYEIDLDA